LERKHAIKVISSTAEPLRPSGRKPVYDAATEALRQIWLPFDQPCSKLLPPSAFLSIANGAENGNTTQV
jgi:hypothetical protein